MFTNLSRRAILVGAASVPALTVPAIIAAAPAIAATELSPAPIAQPSMDPTVDVAVAPQQSTLIERVWARYEELKKQDKKLDAKAARLMCELERRMPAPHPSIVYSSKNDRDGLAPVVPEMAKTDKFIRSLYIAGQVDRIKYGCNGTYGAVQAVIRNGGPRPLSSKKAALLKRLKSRLTLSRRYEKTRAEISKQIGLDALYKECDAMAARLGDCLVQIERARPKNRSDLLIKLKLYDETYGDGESAPRELVRDLRQLLVA